MVKQQLSEQFGYAFDDQLIDSILQVGKLKQFKKDDIIIDIGQDLQYIPLLISGNIKVSREDQSGHELLLYVLERGDTCAMSLTCCLSKTNSKIRAVADKNSSVLMIPLENMFNWFHNNESWRNFILESYQTRFNEMIETIDALAFMKMDERLYKYLIDKVKLNASPTITITHQQISEDLNTSRVVISRLLKQLEDEGKIDIGRNKIEVLQY
ncbi:CRP/FNR family transcriptional regulator [Flavobacteriaceae bacterium MAR_2010_105]|nr:CRP/FNR family transcriptional regulator [Flavobacteriaceae bacterium MAR_2010_105]